MSDHDIREKRWKIEWGELVIPILFLAFSIAFLIQLIGLSFLSLAFAGFSLAVFLPIVIILIFKSGVRRVRMGEVGTPIREDWLARLSPGKILTLRHTDDPAVKQFRFIILFIFSFAVIGFLFGFHAFTFSFSLLSLLALGVKKPVQLLGLTFGITLFMYLVFDKILLFPLFKGELW